MVQTSFASAGFRSAGRRAASGPKATPSTRVRPFVANRVPPAASSDSRVSSAGQHPAGGAEVVQQHPAPADGELAHGEVHGRGGPPRRGPGGRDDEQAVQVRAAVGAQHEVQRGPLEGEPAHHDAAGEQREHVEVEVERGDLQRRAAREAARLGEREAAHADPHRRPQADRDVGQARFAPQRRRELRADHRQHAIVRQQHGERGPGEDGQQRHRPQRDGGDADGGARQRTAVRHGRLPGGRTRRTWRAAPSRLYNAATPPRERRGAPTRGPMEPLFAMRRAAVALALLASLAAGPAARASTEEFSSFDVVRPEEDDESALDHLLARPPAAWRDEWERSPLAFRTSQGCFTSGQWYTHDQLRLVTAVGRRARFALEFDRVESDLLAYDHLDLWLLFPQRAGTLGVMFRPYYDKSRQDFALRWELGADTTRNQLRLTYGFEDLFNNLWVWRQTRVGESGQPYDRHPWEPAVKAALRRERWRVEVEGRWLTLARKRLDATATDAARAQTLWGAWAAAAVGGPRPRRHLARARRGPAGAQHGPRGG